ncbi:Uncharacterised protein [Xylophilus ampelinus]|nr:Uncharacterised protein [Xylophilus ampelinus]
MDHAADRRHGVAQAVGDAVAAVALDARAELVREVGHRLADAQPVAHALRQRADVAVDRHDHVIELAGDLPHAAVVGHVGQLAREPAHAVAHLVHQSTGRPRHGPQRRVAADRGDQLAGARYRLARVVDHRRQAAQRAAHGVVTLAQLAQPVADGRAGAADGIAGVGEHAAGGRAGAQARHRRANPGHRLADAVEDVPGGRRVAGAAAIARIAAAGVAAARVSTAGIAAAPHVGTTAASTAAASTTAAGAAARAATHLTAGCTAHTEADVPTARRTRTQRTERCDHRGNACEPPPFRTLSHCHDLLLVIAFAHRGTDARCPVRLMRPACGLGTRSGFYDSVTFV